MYTQIEGNIFSIYVPLPENPLRNLNSYLVKGAPGERSLLIDTGFRREECREALLTGLEELGVRLEETDICLTHLHSDHSGLAAELAANADKLVVLDDDPTGVQTVHDVSVYTDWTEGSIREGFAERERLFYILTNSRAMTAAESSRAHEEIGLSLIHI